MQGVFFFLIKKSWINKKISVDYLISIDVLFMLKSEKICCDIENLEMCPGEFDEKISTFFLFCIKFFYLLGRRDRKN